MTLELNIVKHEFPPELVARMNDLSLQYFFKCGGQEMINFSDGADSITIPVLNVDSLDVYLREAKQISAPDSTRVGGVYADPHLEVVLKGPRSIYAKLFMKGHVTPDLIGHLDVQSFHEFLYAKQLIQNGLPAIDPVVLLRVGDKKGLLKIVEPRGEPLRFVNSRMRRDALLEEFNMKIADKGYRLHSNPAHNPYRGLYVFGNNREDAILASGLSFESLKK